MTLSRIIILTITLAILGYLGSQLRTLRTAPPLELYSPPPVLTTSNKVIEIKGKTIPGAEVEVNGVNLPILRTGEFEQILVLGRGVNTIVVTAKKRYSKPATIERQIFILEGDKITQGAGGGI